jgi:hypothetical protein
MSRSDWLDNSGSYKVCAKRGGGERGSSDRGISSNCEVSIEALTAVLTEAELTSGSTNATAVTNGFSDVWQQDIEQSIISPLPCPQSISECGAACFLW